MSPRPGSWVWPSLNDLMKKKKKGTKRNQRKNGWKIGQIQENGESQMPGEESELGSRVLRVLDCVERS